MKNAHGISLEDLKIGTMIRGFDKDGPCVGVITQVQGPNAIRILQESGEYKTLWLMSEIKEILP